MKKITIGARGSKLSLAYVAKVRATILKKNPNLSEDDIFIKTIKTSGDIFHDKKNRYSGTFFERYGFYRNSVLEYCGIY